jgi:hypothetical protein
MALPVLREMMQQVKGEAVRALGTLLRGLRESLERALAVRCHLQKDA